MTRPFDKHLDSGELDRLSTWAIPDEALSEARRHADECPECSRKLHLAAALPSEMLRMRPPQPSPATTECMGDAGWVDVAAGLLPPAQARERMKHAAQCGHCGPLLKNAAEALVEESSPGEEAWLAALPSAQPQWRKNMAQRLQDNCEVQEGHEGTSAPSNERARTNRPGKLPGTRPAKEKPGPPWWQGVFAWPRPALGFAGILIAAASGWLGWWALHPPTAEQLLARAYTEHRTLEVRIPGAKYAPMRVERGAAGSSLDKPPALLKAEALIGENLRKNSNDPAWLEAKARADLLDGNADAAIKSLQRALEDRPDDPALLTDLGSAFYVRAEAADRPIDYGNAIEALGKALAKSPDDPVALFNRALACERMFLFTQAVDDWQHYLRIDPQGEWAEDARASLQRVKQKVADREKRSSAPLLLPKEFSAAIDKSHDDAIATLDQRAERYLDTAIHSWLPVAYSVSTSPQATPVEARKALEDLAEILRARHDDTWLKDFLHTPTSSIQKNALQALLASDEALQAGRYGRSLELALESEHKFRETNNHAGMLRASFSLMLAQTVALRAADCMRSATAVSPEIFATTYRWLQIQTSIQQGQCEQDSQLAKALRNTLRGADLAKKFNYPELQLRAIAFGATFPHETTHASNAIRSLIDGLAVFWQSEAPTTRGGNLYSSLEDVSDARGWRYVEEFATAEEVNDFPAQDPVDRAVQWQLLAGAQERAGEYKKAQKTLQTAASQLSILPRDNAVDLRRALIARENAKIDLHLGDYQSAAAKLAEILPQFEAAEPDLFQAEYFKTYGEASLALGLDGSAEPLLKRALSVIETGLRGTRSEAEKLAWSRTQDEVYRDLLEIELKHGTPAESMAWWEWYKGASLRAEESNPTLAADENRKLTPPEMPPDPLTPGTALISYVLLRNSATAFILRDGTVRVRTLQLPEGQTLGTLRFLGLCADPSSGLSFLNAESKRLYDILIAPLKDDIEGAAGLRIETDGVLDQIPFDLLRGPDGRYLSDRFAVTFSPGMAYGNRVGRESVSAASRALVLVSPGVQDSSLAPLPDAADEAADVASNFRDVSLLSGPQLNREEVLRKLRDAEVLHFTGHAVAGADRAGLVLGEDAIVNAEDLARRRPRNLKLAVLSACDTANGEEGSFADVNSLARTLAAAGVPQIVASRWKVDSAMTRQLMRAFYSNLMAGKSASDSLRAAALAVRNLPGYQHPYYWGAFAVFGSS